MEAWLKSSSEGAGPAMAGCTGWQQAATLSLLSHLFSRPRLSRVRGRGLDLVPTHPPNPFPGGCSLGLGCNLGFIRQKAPARPALCFIIPESSVSTAQCPDQTHQHSILLTPPHPIINTFNSQTGLFKPSKIITTFKILIFKNIHGSN